MSLAGYCSTLASPFLLLPIVLRELSLPEQTLWLSLSVVALLGQLTDFGLKPTIVRAVAWLIARQNPRDSKAFRSSSPKGVGLHFEESGALFATIKWLYIRLFFVSLLVGCIIGYLFCRGLIIDHGLGASGWTALILTVLMGAITVSSGSTRATLEGSDQVAFVGRATVFFTLLRICLSVGGLLLGGGLVTLTVISVICAAAQMQFFDVVADKMVGKLGLDWRVRAKLHSTVFRQIWPPMWRSGGIKIGAFLIQQGGALVTARISDLPAVSSYLLTIRLFTVISAVAQVPINSQLARINALRANSRVEELKAVMIGRLRITLGFLLASVIGMGLVGQQFLTAIGSKTSVVAGSAYWLMGLTLVLEVHHSAHATLYSTTNKVPFLVPAVVSGVAIISLGLMLAPNIGIWAVILVPLVVQFSFNNWQPVWLNLRTLNLGLVSYCRLLLLRGERRV